MVSVHGASLALPNARRRNIQSPCIRTLGLADASSHPGPIGPRARIPRLRHCVYRGPPNFWGINFPPLDQSDGSWARTWPMCSGCGRNLIFALNEMGYRVFSANQRFCLGCETRGHNIAWKPVPDLAGAGSGSAEMGKPQVYSHPNESHDLHSGVRSRP
jgi:hypothetical protein